MIIKTLIYAIAIVCTFFGLYRVLFCKDNVALWLVIIPIIGTGIVNPTLNYIDSWIHRKPSKETVSKMPSDLDFMSNQVVGLNSGTIFQFNSQDLAVTFRISKIYEDKTKFYVDTFFDVEDLQNNTTWTDHHATVELNEGNLVNGQTNNLDIFFYVRKTFIGNANLTIGIRKVNRGWIIQNMRFKGKVFRWE